MASGAVLIDDGSDVAVKRGRRCGEGGCSCAQNGEEENGEQGIILHAMISG